MPRKGIDLSVDTSEADAAVGFMEGITANFKSSRYTSSVLKYSHSVLAQDFDRWMDGIAAGKPSRFNHVYEWRMVGNPAGRLWQHKLFGHGKSRDATWEWRPSKTNILTPAERKARALSEGQASRDPIVRVPDDVIEKLGQRDYKFVWKAQIMEYNLPVTIRPKYARRLFIPTFEPTNSGKPYVMADIATNLNPGGSETTGSFTAAWVNYWATVAPATWGMVVQKTIEGDLGKSEAELASVAKRQRSRPKSVTVNVISKAAAGKAFLHGKMAAQAFMDKLAGEYDSYEYYGDDY